MDARLTSKTGPFRGDIAGLRAIAVIVVVLYHFGIPGFKGGFSGVDIFFVISGFLMTGIISKGIDQDRFDLLGFYLARARRIIPALTVLCLCLMVAGWFLLVPIDYLALGKRVASSISFVSNIQYWRDSSAYFNPHQKENWLLHTWSLSVEWQFYLAFPIFMLTARRLFGASITRVLIVVVALCSFALSTYMSPRWPNFAFYTPITRAWELLAGSMVYLFPMVLKPKSKRVMEGAGALLLVTSVVTFRWTDIWPGYLALVPVAGAAMILLAANPVSLLARSKILRSLGAASYSIYLWHWPVAVYLTYNQIAHTPAVLALAITIATGLGYLSWHWVERSSLSLGHRAGRPKVISGYAAATAAIFLMGTSIFVAKGFEWRASDRVNLASSEGAALPLANECTLFRGSASPNCVFGSAGAKVSVIVLGDSHAEFSTSSVVDAAGEGQGVLLLAYQGCMTIADVQLRDADAVNQCGKFMREQIAMLRGEYAGVPVIVINRFSRYVLGQNEYPEGFPGPIAYFGKPGAFDSAYKEEFTRRYVAGICEMSAHHPVYITAPTPEMGINIPAVYARALFKNGTLPSMSITRLEYDQRNEFAMSAISAAANACGAVILDPTQYLCDKDQCNGVVGGLPLYYDDNHLSAAGSRQLVPMYRQIWGYQLSKNQ